MLRTGTSYFALTAPSHRKTEPGAFKPEGYNGFLKEGIFRLLHSKRPGYRCLTSFDRTRCGKWLALVLLASASAAFALAGHPVSPLAPFPATILAMSPAPQAETPEAKGASASPPEALGRGPDGPVNKRKDRANV